MKTLTTLNTIVASKTFITMSAAEQKQIFGHAIFGRIPFMFDTRYRSWVVGPTAGFGGNRNVQDISAKEFHAAIAEKRTVRFSR